MTTAATLLPSAVSVNMLRATGRWRFANNAAIARFIRSQCSAVLEQYLARSLRITRYWADQTTCHVEVYLGHEHSFNKFVSPEGIRYDHVASTCSGTSIRYVYNLGRDLLMLPKTEPGVDDSDEEYGYVEYWY